jgi:N6-adenosine-specific RNA methylase IME4
MSEENQSIVLPESIVITKTALIIPEDTTYAVWIDIGKKLRLMEGAIQFWVGDWINFGEHKYGDKYREALEQTGYDYGTLRHQAWVANITCVPEDTNKDKIQRHENLDYTHHREVASLEPEIANKLLNEAEENDWSVKELRQKIYETKQKIGSPKLPVGKFNLIYADPPWEYDFSISDSRQIENQYPTMSVDKIAELDIQSICDTDTVLFLWATSPKLAESLFVMDRWGFQYKTCMVWVKDRIGMGYYARQKHELLLIGTMGTPKLPEPENRPDSVIVAPRLEHSKKPDEVYLIIEKMYSNFNKIELFARSKRKDWSVWGNQI